MLSCLSSQAMEVHHLFCPTVIENAGPNYHGASNQTALCRPQCTTWLTGIGNSASLLKEPTVITALIEKCNESPHVSVIPVFWAMGLPCPDVFEVDATTPPGLRLLKRGPGIRHEGACVSTHLFIKTSSAVFLSQFQISGIVSMVDFTM